MEFIAKEEGYLMTYTANETNEDLNVFMDDMTVTHTTGPIVRVDDYYPFGLTFNSSKRENSLTNKFTFQGQELQDDLDLNWYSFKWRNHQPDIGRFFNIDPLADKYVYNSPYAFSENKVTNHIELEGLEAVFAQFEGRVSVPLSPILVGVTGSAAVGVAINVNDGKGMIYKTTSLGIQTGIYAGGGLEFGALPTGSIDNIKGVGVNAGLSMTPTIIAGEPFGPDVGAEVNLTVPPTENGEIGQLGDFRLGGTVAIPGLNWSAGGTGYLDFSNTESLAEFNVNDGVDVLKEQIQGLYDQLQDQFENFDVKFEDFQQGIIDMYNSWQESQNEGNR